ncbi:AAA family ATPase, partial [Romboutsia sp.]|uniref:AAA family ATPase n=1 Tax=Romboutsia sp. TaxID=1965302 RepID=UPI002C68582E
MHTKNRVFPFVAVIGQDSIKKALILNIINSNIGGVLISGEKGTAKSTIVRGISNITEDINIVELPLNVTEDRLSGSINFEHAIKKGQKKFEEGILKKAHGNLLYVDEVNLLSDHIAKTLLEVSASGENIVEREGISFTHPSKFILVGSMNPEEGELRPQFLDRFGLYVEAKGENDIRKRTEIIRRRLEYEKNPTSFIKKWQDENEKLRLDIKKAKYDLNKVEVSINAMNLAATIAKDANCAGHRAEITIIETAKALAALDSRIALNIYDIKEAAKYVLPHRVRQKQEQEDSLENENNNQQEENNENQDKNNEPENNQETQGNNDIENNEAESHEQDDSMMDSSQDENSNDDSNDDFNQETSDEENMDISSNEIIEEVGESFTVAKWLSQKSRDFVNKGSGRRSLVKTSSNQGRYVRYSYPRKDKIDDIAIDATLRAAAIHQTKRDKKGRAIAIEKSDIRVKVREKRTGNTIIF